MNEGLPGGRSRDIIIVWHRVGLLGRLRDATAVFSAAFA